jgi:hypothetical protein
MGSIFELIADKALKAEELADECDVCAKSGIPCYPCRAMVVRPDGTADMAQTVDSVCEACFKAGRIAHYGDFDLNLEIDDHASNPEAAKLLLRKTPRLQKFVQGPQWPLCCGHLTEYTGTPTLAEAQELDASGRFWNGGVAQPPRSAAKIIASQRDQGTLSAYHCHRCKKKYWIFQEG